MTEELASYFANLKTKCSILVSLDGPEEIHNRNRIYPNGKGSFDDTIRGLRYVLAAYKAANREDLIHINSVISGPDYDNTLEKINLFIKQTDWIPDKIPINVSHVSIYSPPQKYIGINSQKEFENAKYFGRDPILQWNSKHRNEVSNEQDIVTTGYEKKVFYMIHNRLISSIPISKYHFNGCCIPFSRRTYVTVDGNFLPCEKIGTAPFGGNVFSGINIEAVKKYYVDNFAAEIKKYCQDCWAVNLCGQCYINCYDSDKVNFKNRFSTCRSVRMTLYNDLIEYHKILEKSPESLAYLNDLIME